MAITDLRFAASLLKEGFSADEIRQMIGMKKQDAAAEQAAEQKETEENSLNVSETEESEPETETPAPDPNTEPEPEPEEQKPEEKPKDNPLTRNENQKKESLIDALAKAL